MSPTEKQIEIAVLGGGCFWCLEAFYSQIAKILSITCGYAGGFLERPTYEQVCTGTTGHAEVIRIEFNPSQISYQQVLSLFWQVHDPTTFHRQGADVGSQYRSLILYVNEDQHKIAEKSRALAQNKFTDPVTTEIALLQVFYPAEDSHQQFFQKNPHHPYCMSVIEPKIVKMRYSLE